MLDEVLDLEDLLADGRGEDLLLDRHRHAQSFRVGLCPDEVGVGETDLAEAHELFEADGEEFLGFGACEGPCGGRGEESLAVAAEGYRCCQSVSGKKGGSIALTHLVWGCPR